MIIFIVVMLKIFRRAFARQHFHISAEHPGNWWAQTGQNQSHSDFDNEDTDDHDNKAFENQFQTGEDQSADDDDDDDRDSDDLADFPAVVFHISHWYLSWDKSKSQESVK